MARALAKETGAGQLGSHTVFSAAPHESMCARCGGLMVTDFCMDLLFCIGETEFAAQRCVRAVKLSIPSFCTIEKLNKSRRQVSLQGRWRQTIA